VIRRFAIAVAVGCLVSSCGGGDHKLSRGGATQHVQQVVEATRTAILPPFGSGHTVLSSDSACIGRVGSPAVSSLPSHGFSYDVEPSDDLNAMVAKAVTFWQSRGYDVTSSGGGTASPVAVAFEKSGSQAYQYTVSVVHETPPSLLIAGTIPCAAVASS
jgi:hypothetical protein